MAKEIDELVKDIQNTEAVDLIDELSHFFGEDDLNEFKVPTDIQLADAIEKASVECMSKSSPKCAEVKKIMKEHRLRLSTDDMFVYDQINGMRGRDRGVALKKLKKLGFGVQ